jgi:hypothetical protein
MSFFLCALNSISYFLSTVSGCDGGNQTCNIAVYTWRISLLSYDRHPLSCQYISGSDPEPHKSISFHDYSRAIGENVLPTLVNFYGLCYN